jgi:Chaperone of endosialidase
MKLKPQLMLSISLLLFLAATGPEGHAVVPPPDGDYPGGNTAEGRDALLSLTTGTFNSAVGLLSLKSLTDGSFNSGIGAGALFANVTSSNNTATGAGALIFHTAGNANTANGAFALVNDNSGQVNTAVGSSALFNNISGSFNTAVGSGALSSSIGNDNTAVGATALANTTTGSDNTAVGFSALPNNTQGSNNIAVGEVAGQGVTTADNVICIGAQGSNTSNSCYIGQIFGATATGGSAVFIDANSKLGTLTSSKRFKQDIQQMGSASDALFALKPVTFRYKKEIDSAGTSQFGLVAEDVEKVNPDLVVRDKEGKPYSVRYEAVNAMLLNEFLKARRQIDAQQKQIDALAAGLQKVSAQLELSKSAPQTVLNDQ